MNEQTIDVSRDLAESALAGWQGLFNWIGCTDTVPTVDDLDAITHLRGHIEGWIEGGAIGEDSITHAEDTLRALEGVTLMLLIDLTCEDFLLHDSQSDGVGVLLNGLLGELGRSLKEITEQVNANEGSKVVKKAA
jgi:hypothetical protein